MTLSILVMLVVCIAMPLAHAWRVFRSNEPSWAAWLLTVSDAAVFVLLVFLVGRWDMAGSHTRFLLLAVFLGTALWSLWRHRGAPWRTPQPRRRWTTIASLTFFSAALAYVSYGMLPEATPRELAFPLKNGRFMIGQGGSIALLNHHAGHPEQRFAADITAINGFGFRAAGLAPKALGHYAIYGAAVFSPCDGEVVTARDDLPDLTPPETDRENPGGNHVIIDCGGIHVELAHLQPGSVVVERGVRVSEGAALGKVGNSGNSTEPHLHIHAVDPERRIGLPIAFDGRRPIRNRLYAK